MDPKKETIELTSKTLKDSKPRSFGIEQANKLLKLPNSQWKLTDKNWKWNGTELAKADAKSVTESK